MIRTVNGMLSVRRQATIWTNIDLLSIRPLGTDFWATDFNPHMEK